jgi:acyl-CoA thioester hydrolase
MDEHNQVRFEHRLRVRYCEVDMQGVVFNANYLMYCDEASDAWFRAVGAEAGPIDWEVMVKKAEVIWHSAARMREELAVTVGVSRWGSTSFDMTFGGRVDSRAVFDATLTYVAVSKGSGEKMPVPDGFRAAASGIGTNSSAAIPGEPP